MQPFFIAEEASWILAAAGGKKCNAQKRRKRRHRNTKTRRQRNQSALEAPRDNAPSVPSLPKSTEQENFRKEHVLECGYCEWQRESMSDRCKFVVLRAKMVAIFTMRQCQHKFCCWTSGSSQGSQNGSNSHVMCDTCQPARQKP